MPYHLKQDPETLTKARSISPLPTSRIAEMPPDHRRQMVNALRRLEQEAGWEAPIKDLEEMLPLERAE